MGKEENRAGVALAGLGVAILYYWGVGGPAAVAQKHLRKQAREAGAPPAVRRQIKASKTVALTPKGHDVYFSRPGGKPGVIVTVIGGKVVEVRDDK